MSLVHRADDLAAAISTAHAADPSGVLVEDHIPGLPVTVALLELPAGIAVLPPLATRTRGAEFYDADTS
jgi:D-alanine-D-alanine ligase-like ATP-grasp enzyme